jgi:glycosyltransferase involved in cell wall biosynthesis
MKSSFVCNTRNLSGALTGVQRYTTQLLSRFPGEIEKIAPIKNSHGTVGHGWEQFTLPFDVGNRLLWSPSNTGPLAIERQVLSIHDVSPLDHPEWSNKRFSSWYQFLIPRLVSRVRRILTMSEFSKDRLLHYCPDAISKIHVTHLAADQRFHPLDSVAIASVLRQLNLPSQHYIVVLGSLEPRKNLHTLLKVWEYIQMKLPDEVWLVLAGVKGKALVFGTQAYENLPPRVHLTGHVPDDALPALYSGALASVYLSFYEGFGLPPLEAMSCGTPVLVSNTTSLPEVMGDAGLMVDPLDLDAIGDGLIRLVDDMTLRQNLRNRGLAQAKKFSWDKTAQETWEVLREANLQ